MGWVRPNLSKINAAVLYALTSLCQLGPASADGPTTGYSTIDRIVACLEEGYEAVLLSNGVQCALYRSGAKSLPADMPLKENVKTICDPKNKKAGHDDLRVLPSVAIKMIAERRRSRYGIRIVGAIFCDHLDLVGLELPYSLVIDRSAFLWGIDARNFRTHGDLSFDESLILDELRVTRSRVDGTIFANNSFINKLEVLDTKIGGSLIFRGSVLFEPAIFDTVGLSGELRMRDSLFPYFLLQFSKIGGVLDLTHSQARCAYDIRQSEIEQLVAVDFGFGARDEEFSQRDLDRYSREIKHFELIAAARRNLPRSKPKMANEKSCSYLKIASAEGRFRVSDVQVKSSLCFREFHWLGESTGSARSGRVTFNDVSVTARASIIVEPIARIDPAQTNSGLERNLELVGLQANSFLFKFADFGKDQYTLWVSGLKLEHVYEDDKVCAYDPDVAKPEASPKDAKPEAGERYKGVGGPSPGTSASAPVRDLGRPRVEEVRSWLDENSLVTTQPYAAFIDVFQKNGADNDAKKLQSAKASAELCWKARRLFWDYLTWTCSIKAGNVSMEDYNPITGRLAVLFGLALSWIADHGYHPEWVVGWVLGIMALSVWYFWCQLEIIGLKPEGKETVVPAGVLFLFDRLLPVYQIREDHYHVETFYKRAPACRATYPDGSTAVDVKTMRWHCANINVIEAGEWEKRRADRYLVFLKAVGAVLAIFLLAAINALVSR